MLKLNYKKNLAHGVNANERELKQIPFCAFCLSCHSLDEDRCFFVAI